MRPIVFHVEAAGEFRPVELTFATEGEVRRVRAWRKMTPATDAAEFAALAAKRWFYYTREGATVTCLDDLHSAIRRNPRAELAFLFVASAAWAKRYKFLALAYCRRTWCHHLVLDFLAVRPGVLIGGQPIRGLGTGILASLAGLAHSLGMQTIWGEATASSAPFYEKVLKTKPIKDLFVIRRKTMKRILRDHLLKEERSLAKKPAGRQTSCHEDEAHCCGTMVERLRGIRSHARNRFRLASRLAGSPDDCRNGQRPPPAPPRARQRHERTATSQ